MKKFAALLTVVLIFVSFVTISAQETEVKKAPCKSTGKMAALDSETKVKLEKLKLQYKLDMVDLEAEKAKLHEAVMAEFMKDEPSKKAIEKIAKDVDGVKAKMHKIKMDYLWKTRQLLTPDQFKTFIHKYHEGCSCSCCSSGKCSCGGSGCKHGSASHKCSSSCKSGSSKCSMAGVDGHTCSSACTSSGAKTGCKTPCVNVK
jgi:hypothetical protein